VDATTPTTNYGTSQKLLFDASPVQKFMLKFSVTGTTGCSVTSAKLRLTVGPNSGNETVNGGTIYAVSDNSWTESTLNYNNLPAAGAKVGAVAGSVALNTTYTADVTPAVTGDGVVSLQVSTPSSDGGRYQAKDGNPAAQAPQLQVTCG